MVRRGDRHQIDVRIVEHAAHVLDELWLAAVLTFGNVGRRPLANVPVRIADIGDLRIVPPGERADVAPSTATQTHHRDAESLAGALALRFFLRTHQTGRSGHGRGGCGKQRVLQQFASRQMTHGICSCLGMCGREGAGGGGRNGVPVNLSEMARRCH